MDFFFLPSHVRTGKWRIKVQIEGDRKKKVCDKVHSWQYMKWTEVTGSWMGNGKPRHVRVLDCHGTISLKQINEGRFFPIQTKRKYQQV